MARLISLRVLLICFLVWALLTVGFGWTVISALRAGQSASTFGKGAVVIATFPTTVGKVFHAVASQVSSDIEDEALRVRREVGADYTGFVPIRAAPGITVEGLMLQTDEAAMSPGWRLLTGAFAVDGEIDNAAVLISPELEIVRVWRLDETAVDGQIPQSKYRKLVHGAELLDDGSLIFVFDGGTSIQRFDVCGDRLWATGGAFSHTVSLADDGKSVWTLSKDSIVQVAVQDGTVLREIPFQDVIDKNSTTDIFGIRMTHSDDLGENSRNTTGTWLPDPFHLNDVEPLPAAIADRFAGFEGGDLLVSLRSLNLLFVLAPETLEVKWWRIGAVQRQHDPDWQPTGEITVLNNRMGRDISEIVSIDPASLERTTILDGKAEDFYTRIRGKHQRLADGTQVVTSAQQGRAFEVGPDGQIVFEVVNLKPGSDTMNYVISEMKWFAPDHFTAGELECPGNN